MDLSASGLLNSWGGRPENPALAEISTWEETVCFGSEVVVCGPDFFVFKPVEGHDKEAIQLLTAK